MMFQHFPRELGNVDLSYQVLKTKPGCGAFITFPEGP